MKLRYPVSRMPRRSPSSSTNSEETPADRLQDVVQELSANLRVIADIADQVREDISWLTRNGLPHQPIHVFVHRLPLLTDDKSQYSSMDLSVASMPVNDPTVGLTDDRVRGEIIDQVVSRLAEPLGELAQEHLNLLAGIIDHAHRDIMQAIRDPRSVPTAEPKQPVKATKGRTKKDKPAQVSPPTAAEPISPKPPPGRLF